jgi:hypothetical protein
MATSRSFVPASDLQAPGLTRALPRDGTFTETDWRALAPFWYPVAHSHEVTDKPLATRLLTSVSLSTASRTALCRRLAISATTAEFH